MSYYNKGRNIPASRKALSMDLFSIKDEKIGAFGKVVSADSVVTVMRSLTRAVLDPANVYGEFPADFSLWKIGRFDERSAEITQDQQHIINLADLKNINMETTQKNA